jgi:hypothetical protein
MVAILLILLIILLFAALPTWPYTASGRSRYHVAEGERTARTAELPQLNAAHFRELQKNCKALDGMSHELAAKARIREAGCVRRARS